MILFLTKHVYLIRKTYSAKTKLPGSFPRFGSMPDYFQNQKQAAELPKKKVLGWSWNIPTLMSLTQFRRRSWWSRYFDMLSMDWWCGRCWWLLMKWKVQKNWVLMRRPSKFDEFLIFCFSFYSLTWKFSLLNFWYLKVLSKNFTYYLLK